MRRYLTILLVLLAFTSSSVNHAEKPTSGTGSGKVPIQCPKTLYGISDCPDTGCGPSIDPNLNRLKNIRSDDRTTELISFHALKNLPDPVPDFRIGGDRLELKALGEGKKIQVVAFALVARKGGAESCNCKLLAIPDTDNMIVLVDPSVKQPTLAKDEEDSLTAEFTPRVRLNHPGLSRANLQPLIAAAPNYALLVRVTGLLMFDSEHSVGHRLRRHNNWEIHPVLGLDYCPKGKRCTAGSDANWKDLEK